MTSPRLDGVLLRYSMLASAGRGSDPRNQGYISPTCVEFTSEVVREKDELNHERSLWPLMSTGSGSTLTT
jgi:hypothetical protein